MKEAVFFSRNWEGTMEIFGFKIAPEWALGILSFFVLCAIVWVFVKFAPGYRLSEKDRRKVARAARRRQVSRASFRAKLW